ncbi:MAG: phage baseplate assembly protein V [Acidimicrobiales bacterium]
MSTTIAIPAVQVTADGATLATEALTRLVAVRVAVRLSAPAQCELTFAAPLASNSFSLGSPLAVGVVGEGDLLFEGEVTAFEHVHGADGEALFRVRGYDVLHRLRKRQEVRVHENVTVEELAATLVADVGLSVDATVAGPRWARLFQHRQSDLELLGDVCDRSGLHFVAAHGRLRLITLDGFGDDVELSLGTTLQEARIEVNLETATERVGALAWDPIAAEPIEAEADSPRVGRNVGVDTDPSAVGVDGHRTLIDESGLTADHVEAAAQGWLDRRVARTVTLSGVADGDARLRAGGRVELTGVGDDFAGAYVLTEAVHTIDASGYRTTISSRPPEPRPRPKGASVTLGRITSVDDPDRLGRVRVALPAYGDVESVWFGVVVPAAGRDKGVVALPDVDDTVLVALPHEDPAEGIVLGGLYGTVAPPDSGVDDDAVKRYTIRTPGGQRAVLDDGNERVLLTNSQGSHVELAPEHVRVFATTDLLIEAPGRSITIRAKGIDFMEAPESEPVEPPEGGG